MTQVVDIDVTSLTFEWTTSKDDFCGDKTPVFQFLGYSWYIECFVDNHGMYRITLQNQIQNEHIELDFYVKTFLDNNYRNCTTFLETVRIVQNPRRRLWESHENDIAAYIPGFDLNAEFTIVCQFSEELAPLIPETRSETIVRELHGLALGSHPQHGEKVKFKAKKAIQFIEHEFSKEKPCLEALTSKGSNLYTISFMYEDLTKEEGTTNDDLILSSCLNYRKKIYPSQDLNSSQNINKKVVLLTEDRELRKKSEAENVPVTDVFSLLKKRRSRKRCS